MSTIADDPGNAGRPTETLIAGAGAIATGLAALATIATDVIVWARSVESAQRAAKRSRRAARNSLTGRGRVAGDRRHGSHRTGSRHIPGGGDRGGAPARGTAGRARRPRVTSPDRRGSRDHDLVAVGRRSWGRQAASGRRFAGLHVFNPVQRMAWSKSCSAPGKRHDARAHDALCVSARQDRDRGAGHAGFVVNRLLFPYLFEAVEFMTANAMEPEQVDTCMTLGAGLPMGPLALLDFVGLDVAKAIGRVDRA